jgi:hypothetical protein
VFRVTRRCQCDLFVFWNARNILTDELTHTNTVSCTVGQGLLAGPTVCDCTPVGRVLFTTLALEHLFDSVPACENLSFVRVVPFDEFREEVNLFTVIVIPAEWNRPRCDDLIARLNLVALRQCDLTVPPDEHAVGCGHFQISTVFSVDLIQRLVNLVTDDLINRLEFRSVVVPAETEHLVAFVSFSIRLDDIVDNVSNFHKPGVPGGVTNEPVFLAVDAHQDDLLVASLLDIEFFANPGSDCRDQCSDLVVLEDPIETVFLDVEDFSLDRENCLVLAVATLLCTPAGAIPLHDE